MVTAPRTVLTLADLERYDPQAPARDGERAFCCPSDACRDKPVDARHRKLYVNTATGRWYCQRCHAGGLLGEYQSRAPLPRRAQQYRAARRVFALPAAPKPAAPTAALWPKHWERTRPLADSPGARYLASRRLPVELAIAAGVRWAPQWYAPQDTACGHRGRPAVVYPIKAADGTVVAVNARYLDACAACQKKTITLGTRSLGVFTALPNALQADPLVLVEGPADCLALAAIGVPSVALVATAAPRWLIERAMLRRVLLALDADDRVKPAVAQALDKLAAQLAAVSARVERLRPLGDDDWAADLQRLGADALRAALAPVLPEFLAAPWVSETVLDLEHQPWDAGVARALCGGLYRRLAAAHDATPAAQRVAVDLHAHELALQAAVQAQDLPAVRRSIHQLEAAAGPVFAAYRASR